MFSSQPSKTHYVNTGSKWYSRLGLNADWDRREVVSVSMAVDVVVGGSLFRINFTLSTLITEEIKTSK